MSSFKNVERGRTFVILLRLSSSASEILYSNSCQLCLSIFNKFGLCEIKTDVEFVTLLRNIRETYTQPIEVLTNRVLDAVRTTSRSELAQRDKDEPRVAALGQGPGETRARGDVTYVAWARGKLASQLDYGCSHATTATHSVIKVCLFDFQNYIPFKYI